MVLYKILKISKNKSRRLVDGCKFSKMHMGKN